MTVNTNFEAYKVRRELKRSGVDLTFKRKRVNEFGEPLNAYDELGTARCLYHEQNGRVEVMMGDTTNVRTKKLPCLLTTVDEIEELQLRPGDYVDWKEQKYVVTGLVDVQNWGIIADVTLEVVDDGVQARL